MNQLLEAATRYAMLGWHVFPIKPGQKTPLTTHGVKDATTDADQILTWWTKWPDANIAVACGRESGVYVVDVDVTEDGEVSGLNSLVTEFEPLPATAQQYTPRGGFHAFYQSDNPPANKNSFRPGIDIRGDGYYVLLAPSVRADGNRYQWGDGLSPWDTPLAEYPDFMRPASRTQTTPNSPTPVRSQPVADNTLQRAGLYLARCDSAVQGQAGHDKLFWAAGCMTWGYELSADQAYDILAREYNPRCIPPWDLSDRKEEKDFRRKITESIRNPPQKPRGWLLHEDGYAETPITVTGLDIQMLIVNAGLAPADSIRGTTVQRVLSLDASLPSEEGVPDHWRNYKAVYTDTNREPLIEKMREARKKTVSITPHKDELDFLTQPTGLFGEICSWINATSFKSQPYLTLACVLAFLGTLFGRKVRDSLGSRTNLYCMSVAQSSAGKAHAMDQIRSLCMAADCVNLLGGSDIASDSAIESRIAREPATLFMLDEIGHLLVHIKSGASKHHMQIVSLLMQLYSAAKNVYLGREYAEVENQRKIIQPCCCIYGVATPDKFTEGLSPSELEDGWLSRCLVFYATGNPRKRRGVDLSAPPPARVVEMVNAWAKRDVSTPTDGKAVNQFVVGSAKGFTDAPPEQIVVLTSADAEKRFIEFDDMAELMGRQSRDLEKSWAKAEENARRIALIIACSDNYAEPVITAQAADRACRMVERIVLDFGKYITPEITSGRTEAEKRKIFNVINEYGKAGCLKREITRRTQWASNKIRNDGLADMMEAGIIICLSTETGRGVRYWAAEYVPSSAAGGECG